MGFANVHLAVSSPCSANYPKLATMIHLLLLLLLLVVWPPTEVAQAASATVSPLFTNCSQTAGTYTANSSYRSNLRDLGAALAAGAHASGFAKGSTGEAPYKVYGLVLCRGDYAGADCTNGLKTAFLDAMESACPWILDSTVYYDQYMLRFTEDEHSLSSLANAPEWSGMNMNSVRGAGAAARFMDTAVELMGKMADYAAFNTSSLYATGQSWFGEQGVGTVYGLVQCTPDLTGPQCRSCLDGIIKQMPVQFGSAAESRVGGRILGVRCDLRYEKDLFFMESSKTLKLNMPKERLSTARKIVIFGVPALVLLIILTILRPYIVRQVRELILQRDVVMLEKEIVSGCDSRFSLFSLSKIKDATCNFSERNKIGEGGFGPVYQGRFRNNQQVAVKRLSPNSRQGFREFKNEIILIASLQHKNLVRLLGCCIKSKERILVYEHMTNGSLEDLIYGTGAKQNWAVRRCIIEGIAEGLLYMHNYAHECIVHRDLKPSNILLDHEMNPKISDFGIARICLSNVAESSTTTGMGTFGYIAPEYYNQNVYSTRSDVFSFGILVLEIISGKRAAGSYMLSGRSHELRKYAWQLWRDQRCDELVDPSLGEDYQEMDVVRCIQVALLCVQDSAEDRPTMQEVTTMLSNSSRCLLPPAQPGSFNVDIVVVGDTEELSR